MFQIQENKNQNFYGKYGNYIIKDLDMFMIYSIEKKKYQENYMNIVLMKNGIMKYLINYY